MRRSQSHPNTKKVIISATVLVIVAGGLAGCLVMLIKPANVQAQQVRSGYTKHLRPLGHHNYKAVCGVLVEGRARCASYITTNGNGAPLTGTPALTDSLGPMQFHTAYNLPCTPGGQVQAICTAPSSFGPETIAIVDSGGFSAGGKSIESALGTYDTNYGLPACTVANGCMTIVNQSGATSPLPASNGWETEIALDVETTHMVCQTCKILLVETNSNFLSDLAAGVATAQTFDPIAISNSWYATSIDDTSLDSDFNDPSTAIVAATGDVGSTSISWPADNPNVIGAAGTTLQLNSDNTWAGETVWSGSGGSCSTNYTAPTWQTNLPDWTTNGCGSYKAFGDLSADADPNSGAAVYVSSWEDIGGTSLATPLIAGMFALAGLSQVGNQEVSIPYGAFTGSNSHNITSGSNCTHSGQLHCTAAAGFNTPSGLGSPNGLNGFQVSAAADLADTIGNYGGTQVNLSWQASTNGSVGGYYVYRNGTKIATISSTTYNDTSVAANTSYSYDVVAYDAYHNVAVPTSTANITTYLPADINQDGHVDLLDLSLLATDYGQCSSNLGRADIDKDGCVNLLDLSLLASKYGSE